MKHAFSEFLHLVRMLLAYVCKFICYTRKREKYVQHVEEEEEDK